jgi:hypothetical protein
MYKKIKSKIKEMVNGQIYMSNDYLGCGSIIIKQNNKGFKEIVVFFTFKACVKNFYFHKVHKLVGNYFQAAL